MHPLVRGAAFVALLSALGGLDRSDPADPAAAASSHPRLLAPCPPGGLPDGDACVPVPAARDLARRVEGDAAARERIPRRPDRPEDLARYPSPVTSAEVRLEGGDLFVTPEAKADVRLLPVEGQQGEAEVVYVGDLDGLAVLTKHQVPEGERTRTFVVAYSGLAAIAPGLAPGDALPVNGVIGQVSGPLRVRVRLVREGVDLARVTPSRLLGDAVSIATDARNAIELAVAP